MAGRKIPTRQCVGCREMKAKKELIRVIRTAEDTVEIDVSGKKNGRGAYICPDAECLRIAMKNKSLERSLKTAVPDSIYEDFKREMSQLGTE